MYLWRKSFAPRWFAASQSALQATVAERLVVIERPGRKRLQVEICCYSAQKARRLVKKFGGHVEKLPNDWLEGFARTQSKSIRIGKRLVISRSRRDREANSFPCSLVIPAAAAFGTGDHATTAMSLRLLEEVSRKMKHGWSLVDFGTGSGILALAAKCFGARRVIGLDNDARAIATARENARMNKIDNVDFQVADVRRWKSSAKFALSATARVDIVTANLFSELLIEILPMLKAVLKRDGRMILSGVLRKQERELRHALRLHKIDIAEVRRRGKWIATLANRSGAL